MECKETMQTCPSLYLVAFLLITSISMTISTTSDCNHLYLKPSDTMGVSVVAGRRFMKGEIIERVYGVPLNSFASHKTILSNYVFKSGNNGDFSDHSMVFFGYAMLYNHNDTANVSLRRVKWADWIAHVVAVKDIEAGEEILNRYGIDMWFAQRGLLPVFMERNQHASNYPGCPHMYTSLIGDKLIAAQAIKAGTIIETSRGLILPGVRVLLSDLDAFVWYREHSLLGALLVLGHGAFYGPPALDDVPNVKYQWYHDERQGKSVDCNELMLISFVATRDIAEGEPLTIHVSLEYEPNTQAWRKRIFDDMLSVHCF